MSNEQTHLNWKDGLPTKPEVDAMLKAWPPETLSVGTRISDSDIRAVIGDATPNRFYTVCKAWRRRLQSDFNITVYRAAKQDYFVPTPDEIIGSVPSALRHIGQTAGRKIRDLVTAKPENDTQRDTLDHQGRLLGHLKREAKKARMNILPPVQASVSPRIEPPKKGEKQ